MGKNNNWNYRNERIFWQKEIVSEVYRLFIYLYIYTYVIYMWYF